MPGAGLPPDPEERARHERLNAVSERNPDLYTGAARYYTQGRMAYPPEIAERLTELLGLDGTGRLLDVGCGPGSLTLLFADRFASAVGVDADAGMLAEARRWRSGPASGMWSGDSSTPRICRPAWAPSG